MKRLRVDVYTGWSEDKTNTYKDSWVQLQGETNEDLADRVRELVLENLDSLIESEGEESDDTDELDGFSPEYA